MHYVSFLFQLTECPRYCSEEFTPVCGSDGTTYWNICSLKQAICYEPWKQDLVLDYEGECQGKWYKHSNRGNLKSISFIDI